MHRAESILRLLARAEPRSGDTCWLWRGARTRNGYGTLRIDGRTTYAHRLAYELFHRAILFGEEIDHLCANRACINPAHLEAVGHAENVWRAGARRRGAIDTR